MRSHITCTCSESANNCTLLAADILLFNDVAVLYKREADLIFIVTGSQDENELILNSVLNGLSEALNILMRCASRV